MSIAKDPGADWPGGVSMAPATAVIARHCEVEECLPAF